VGGEKACWQLPAGPVKARVVFRAIRDGAQRVKEVKALPSQHFTHLGRAGGEEAGVRM
jgi:hypothetical protein